jgi:hypothetical protein
MSIISLCEILINYPLCSILELVQRIEPLTQPNPLLSILSSGSFRLFSCAAVGVSVLTAVSPLMRRHRNLDSATLKGRTGRQVGTTDVGKSTLETTTVARRLTGPCSDEPL